MKPSSSTSQESANTDSSDSNKGDSSDQGEVSNGNNSDSDSGADEGSGSNSDSESGSEDNSSSDSNNGNSSDNTSDNAADNGNGENVPSSSASQESIESSNSAPIEESSSSAVLGQSTIMIDENTASVGTENMEKVSASETVELDAWKDAISKGETVDGFVLSDKLNFGYADMDFDNYVYYCFSGDNEWLRIPFENLKGSGLPFLWNGAAWGLQRKYILRFEDACAAIYVQRKQ